MGNPESGVMVKTRNIDTIKQHPYNWKRVVPKTSNAPVFGLDTETKVAKGKNQGCAHLLTISTPDTDYVTRINSFTDFVQACRATGCNHSINFFYNVDFDFSAIAKWMGLRPLTDIASVGVTTYKGFEISWIPNKSFTVHAATGNSNGRGNSFTFYDLAQFYDKKPLRDVAPLVGKKKLEFDVKSIDFDRYDSEKKYRETVDAYASEDAVIARLAGLRLHKAVNAVIPVSHYYSNASISQTYFLAHIPDTLRLPPRDVMDAALQAYGGGRFELLKRGYFPAIWEIDINSAYPFEMDSLVGITDNGKWKHVTTKDDDAHYGIYNITTQIHTDLFSPMMIHREGAIVYPNGTFTKWVDKSELDLITKMGFKVRIHEGYEYHDNLPTYPFRFISKTLYPERMRHRSLGNEDMVYVFKIIPNAGYGKTIQIVPDLELLDELPIGFDKDLITKEIEHDNGHVQFAIRNGWKAGRMFNPVYAMSITARTRVRLLETVIKHRLEKSVVGFATDAMFLKRAPPESLIGKGLGQWKLEIDSSQKKHEGLFIGSGVYAIRDGKEITDPITKTKKTIDVNHYRGFVTKHNLFEYVISGYIVTQIDGEERRGIRFDMEAPVKLKEGVRGSIRTTPVGEEQITWRDIAVFKPVRKLLDLNFDKKRVWDMRIDTPHDLLNNEIGSKPMTVQP